MLEIRPPIDADKGTAVGSLLDEGRRYDRALYAGDDTTDLDAFRGLDGLDVGRSRRGRLGRGPGELAARGGSRRREPEGAR